MLDALLPQADVFLQNLAPGAAKRLGLDAATLVARFPRLIACDISGYGSGGPYGEKKAYDLLVQCEAGFLSINGTRGTAGEMRHRRRRHRDRHVHRQRRADGAVQPRAHRQGNGVRGLAVRFHDRMDELSRLLHRWRRQAAGPHRHAARHHRALRSVSMRRRAGGVLRHSERARMDRALRAGAGGCGAGQRSALLRQSAAHEKSRRAGGADRAAVREIFGGAGDPAARRRGHRQCQHEHGRKLPRSIRSFTPATVSTRWVRRMDR